MINQTRLSAIAALASCTLLMAGSACFSTRPSGSYCGEYSEIGEIECCETTFPQFIVWPTVIRECYLIGAYSASGQKDCDDEKGKVRAQICQYTCIPTSCQIQMLPCGPTGPECDSAKLQGGPCDPPT